MGKLGRAAVLHGNEARAQGADILAQFNLGGLQYLRPSVEGIAGKCGRHVPAAIDGRDMEGIGETVEAQCPGERKDDAAVDQPALEWSLRLCVLIEMNPGRVLIEAGGDLVLGLLQRHGLGVIDSFADGIIAPAMGAARQGIDIARQVEAWQVLRQMRRIDPADELRDDRLRWRRRGLAFAHHHPAHELKDILPARLAARRADIDDARPAVGIYPKTTDFRGGRQRVAGIDGRQEAALGVAQIGNGIEGNIRNAFAEHDMEDHEIVDRCPRVADRLGKGFGRLHGEAGAIKAMVKRDIADRDRAWGRVFENLPDPEVLEEVAGIGLGGGGLVGCHRVAPRAKMASAMATVRAAILAWSSSTMRPSTVMTPLPAFSGCAKAARILRANASSAAAGAKIALASATWSGWIKVLPSKPSARPSRQAPRKPSRSLKSL